MKTHITLILFHLLFISAVAQNRQIIEPPAGTLPALINKSGTSVIPNGRFLTPLGKQIVVAPHPYGLTISPDGNTLVTANSGTSPLSITIIRNINSENPEIQQIPPGANTDKGVLASVFMGLAISPDSKKVYVAGGQENKIYIFDLETGNPSGEISCYSTSPTADFTNGYIGDLVLTKDGKRLYAVDQLGFRVVTVDVEAGKLIDSTPVGRYPFGIQLSPDEKKVYVANVGMYEYKLLENLDPDNLAKNALDFPAFSFNSEESKNGIYNDSLQIPGLGDPNSPESFSVWTLEVSDNDKLNVVAKTKTGFLVGQVIDEVPAVGGSSPNSIVATKNHIFISNGNNDCISVLDSKTHKLIDNIFLKPHPTLAHLRGVIPFGLAISPDEKRLYVAEAGINAIAVINIKDRKVMGHIPTAWFPSKLEISTDGKQLIVSNAKGFGSGPNGGKDFVPGPEGSNIGRLMKGVVSIFDIPSDSELKALTQQVIDNNFRFYDTNNIKFKERSYNPIPLFPGEKESPIKYWVFIPKENRTYDEVFGQLEQANGDPTLARFGENVTFSNRNSSVTLQNASVMPNHLELAKRFAFSDNFFVDADHSADGHRWLVGTYPNEWVETSVSANYGGNRSMKRDSQAPGNLAVTGSSSAIYPEDYNEAGSMWDHFDRHNINYFNFGLGLGLAARLNDRDYLPLSVKYMANYPLPASLYDNSSRIFPVYNMAIPDQYRVDMFIKEYEARWAGEDDDLPSVLTLRIPNDHGAGEREEDGYPFLESYMADNDLAIGRTVEFLSKTKYWKNMAIIITEDDSQGGVDHVDAHRSILMIISPYAKKEYVGKRHYSFGSIFKTIWNSLGIPYLNQYDAAAEDMSDLFTGNPDYTPYETLKIDPKLFDPEKAWTPLDPNFNWKALEEHSAMDDPDQMLKDSKDFDRRMKDNKK